MFSINIQVIVDGRLLFLDIGSRRIPWQSHDARILWHIAIHSNEQDVEIVDSTTKAIERL